VFHQAAVVSVPLSVADPVGSADVNEMGTLKVLEAARARGVRRIVLASSSAVYGDDPELPKTEAMPPRPLSPYAVQKFTNECYADLYRRLYGIETVCLRYFNVFGPRQDPSSPYSGVISIFMERAAAGRGPVIYGDGGQSRDFVFASDVARANLAAAERPDAAGGVFNVGTGCSVTVAGLWEAVRGLAGIDLESSHEAPREGDIRHSLAGVDRLRDRLGFAPEVAFEDGLRITYDWYRQHPSAKAS
jgi:UDP-glucose 4-epimerase